MRPANTLRETIARYSSFLRNCSSNRSPRSGSGEARVDPRPKLHLLGCALEDLGEDAVRVDALGLAFEVQDQPMAHRVRRHPTDVLAGGREAPVDQRTQLGAEHHGLGATRRAAVA